MNRDKYLPGMSYGQSGGPQSIRSRNLNPRIKRPPPAKELPQGACGYCGAEDWYVDEWGNSSCCNSV